MSKEIKKDKAAGDLYEHLNEAFETQLSIADPLPGHSCKSKAVSTFRSRSQETKALFKSYRKLFGSDNETFKAFLKRIEETDDLMASNITQ